MTHQPSEFRLSIPLEYIETTIPVGMTVSAYARRRAHQPTRWARLKHLADGASLVDMRRAKQGLPA